jgi:uncharacterized NAD(P)/FAD-binding protein YdhS
MTEEFQTALPRGRRSFAITAGLREDAPAELPGATIAVIGGGFSGTLLTLHLLRRCRDARVLLIECNQQFGRGLAYGTGNDTHLLNVPAGKMSAFQDRPHHFADWLAAQHAEGREATLLGENSFVPRRLFGAYIRHLLNMEMKTGAATRLELLRGEVVDIEEGRHLVLSLDRGRRVAAHLAIVAVGNFPPEPPLVADPWLYESPWYRGDPWGADTLTNLDPATPVLLIGTGLTMIDTVLSLLDQGHEGPLYALSRRGLLPRHHARQSAAPEFPSTPLPATVSGLMRLVRTEIIAARARGASWQAVIDGLRPVTQELWLTLPPVERARFLRHLRPWWDVHRHRVSPGIAARIDAALKRGQLTVAAGRLTGYARDPDGITAHYRALRRGDGRIEGIGRVINCSGPACDFARIQNPLIAGLLAHGKARPDDLRLGLDVTLQGALRGRDGAISQRLYAVGPLTKGVFWEMTAVPDIRRQCELMAAHLAQRIAASGFPALEAPVPAAPAAHLGTAPWAPEEFFFQHWHTA